MSDEPYHIKDNDTRGFVGVDPEYQNYSTEKNKPIITESFAEVLKKVEPDTSFVHAGADEEKGDSEKESSGAEKPSNPESPAKPAGPAAPSK